MALVVGIVPLFTDCLSQGLTLKLANGTTAPMKCHWTALAAVGAAIPMGLLGILTFLNKRRESVLPLALMGAVLGAVAIALPTVLIGVCANPTHICNAVMKPTMILGGTIALAASLSTLLVRPPQLEQPA